MNTSLVHFKYPFSKHISQLMMYSKKNDQQWQVTIFICVDFKEYVEFQRSLAWNNSLILLWQMFWRSLMMPTSGIAGNLTPFRGESFSYPFRGRWFEVKSSEMRRSRLPVKWYVKNTLQLLLSKLPGVRVFANVWV